MSTHICVEKITLFPQGDKAEVDRVYKYIRDGMEVQSYMMNLCISALYTAKMRGADKDEIKEIKHLYSRVPTSKKGSAYDFDMAKYPTGLSVAGNIPHICQQKLNKSMKDGLKYGRVSLPTFKINTPLYVGKRFIDIRGTHTTSSGQIRDNGLYHDYNSPMELAEGLENDNNPKIHIKFTNGIIFDLVLGNPYQSRRTRLILESVFSGEYKVCDSSVGIIKDKKGNSKIVLYLTYEKEVDKRITLDENVVVGVDLGLAVPAMCAVNNNAYKRRSLGSYDDFIRERTKIQAQRRRVKKSLKYAHGGNGREKKLAHYDKLSVHERNWVNTYNHKISKDVVDFAIQNHAKYINMECLKGIAREEKDKFVLGNWSYYELQKMIEHKAQGYGIEVRYVKPAYTSQVCSVCGKTGFRKTQKDFVCSDPDCKSHKMYSECGGFNADFNAARNISMSENFIKENSEGEQDKTA